MEQIRRQLQIWHSPVDGTAAFIQFRPANLDLSARTCLFVRFGRWTPTDGADPAQLVYFISLRRHVSDDGKGFSLPIHIQPGTHDIHTSRQKVFDDIQDVVIEVWRFKELDFIKKHHGHARRDDFSRPVGPIVDGFGIRRETFVTDNL